MAKPSKIRWKDNDKQELKRVIKNFNEKVNYWNKKEPQFIEQRPDTVKFSDIKDKIFSRRDLKNFINKFKRFSKRGVEEIKETKEGVILTKWEQKELSIQRRSINLARKKKAEELDIKAKESETEVLIEKMSVDKVRPSGFEKYKKSLEKEFLSNFNTLLNEQYKDNYIMAINTELGFYGKEIIEIVNKIDLEVFVKNSLINPFLRIEFCYTDGEKRDISEQIMSEWKRIIL